MMEETPRNPVLSVVVPAYNRPDDIATLLKSLEGDLHRIEVIVVDDCSPDPGIYDRLKSRYPQVCFVRQEHNRGPAAARNRGARQARCELLFFVDSDTAVVPGVIDAILQIYQEHPDFLVCGGSCDRHPINSGLFPEYKALLDASWVMDRESGITYVGHIGARAFTIKRSAMLAVGGFNEDLPSADVEDYEFGYRFRRAHGMIPFSTNIRVRHRYDTLLNQAKLYFRRVIMWWDLRSESPGADSVGSTSREAAVAILSTLTCLTAVLALWHPPVWTLALLCGLAAVGLNHRFLRLCLQERGIAFAVVALAMHTFLSWFICAGATVALLRSGFRWLGSLTRSAPRQRAAEAGDVF